MSPGAGPAASPAFRFSRETGYFLIILLGMIFSRGAFVWYESLHFDSDQAVVGLMGLDLVRGQGFTVYYYGLGYLASIEPYLAAPCFALFGASRLTLKLPLLLMGVAVAFGLYVAFRRDAGVSPRLALVGVLPFVLPTVVMSSRLTEANGGNLDVFLWLMVLWFVRRRPVLLGLVAGLSIQCRLFCAYGVVSLSAILLSKREWKTRHYLMGLVCGLGMYFLIGLLARHSLNNFGAGAPVRISTFGEALRLFRAGCTQLVPFLFGFVPTELARFNITSALVTHTGIAAILSVASMAVLFGSGVILFRHRPRHCWEFPSYLLGCGLLCLPVFCALQGDLRVDRMQIRYLLVMLLLPMGYAGLVFRTPWRSAAVAALLCWCGINVAQGTTLWADLAHRPPPDPYGDLADALRRSDYTVAAAEYGTSYYVTFLLAEEKIVASTGAVRIPEYREAFEQEAGTRRAVIYDRAAACPDAIRVHRWTICPVPPDFR